MTRKEEIHNEAYIRHGFTYQNVSAFEEGAEWADEHPKEGLININEACEWFRDNVNRYSEKAQTLVGTISVIDSEKMINDLKKTMIK